MKTTFALYVSYFIVLLAASFSVFYNLGSSPLACWDESRQAINAIEMSDYGNPLITTFEGEVDLWNTKPSLLAATQALSMRIFGINEFALRLPTALSAVILCLFIFHFFVSQFKSVLGGIVAVFVLLSFSGYNGYHGVRTGDFEGFLALFSTAYLIAFFLYVESNNQKYLHWFGLFLVLTVLSKGVAGLMFAPGLAIYLALEGKLLRILSSQRFWATILVSASTILLYYLYRNIHNPGYLLAVYDNELGGRFGKVVEGHRGEWNYYISALFSNRASPWILLYPLGLLFWVYKLRTDRIFSKPILYFSLLTICWLFFISTAKTKIEWYDFPMFPLIAFTLGLLFAGISRHYTSRRFPYRNKKYVTLALVFIVVISSVKIIRIMNTPIPTCEYCIESNHFGELVNSGIQEGRDFSGYAWATGFKYYATPLFYIEKLKREQGQTVTRKRANQWEKGDKIFMLQPMLLDSVPQNMKAKLINNKFGILEVQME